MRASATTSAGRAGQLQMHYEFPSRIRPARRRLSWSGYKPELLLTRALPPNVHERAQTAFNLRMPGQPASRDWFLSVIGPAEALLCAQHARRSSADGGHAGASADDQPLQRGPRGCSGIRDDAAADGRAYCVPRVGSAHQPRPGDLRPAKRGGQSPPYGVLASFRNT
jgi:hypothetical protein